MSGTEAQIALALATPIGLAVALFDLRTMEIPNWLTGAAAAVFLAFVFAVLPLDEALTRLAAGLVVLLICMLLFFAGMMGGGDGKAAAAFAPMVAPVDAAFTLVLLSVLSILSLAVIALLRSTVFAGGGRWQVWSATGRVPYGVALGGTLIAYLALVAFLVN